MKKIRIRDVYPGSATVMVSGVLLTTRAGASLQTDRESKRPRVWLYHDKSSGQVRNFSNFFTRHGNSTLLKVSRHVVSVLHVSQSVSQSSLHKILLVSNAVEPDPINRYPCVCFILCRRFSFPSACNKILCILCLPLTVVRHCVIVIIFQLR